VRIATGKRQGIFISIVVESALENVTILNVPRAGGIFISIVVESVLENVTIPYVPRAGNAESHAERGS
jgi:hypothetical protein